MKKILFLFILFFSNCIIFSLDISDSIDINKIKIGERINLDIELKDDQVSLNNMKILSVEINKVIDGFELIDTIKNIEESSVKIRLIFTIFEPGKYEDVVFLLFIDNQKGDVLKLNTSKYSIQVERVFTPEEIELIKSSEDPQEIKFLKPPEDLEKFSFEFSGIVKTISILLLILLLGLISYYILYNFIFKKKNDNRGRDPNLSPYEQFLVDINRINFDINDSSESTSLKISQLTEVYKELISNAFHKNAPASTTNELISILRSIRIDSDSVNTIKKLFNRLDMVKFAKSSITYDELMEARELIVKSATEINHSYLVASNIDEVK